MFKGEIKITEQDIQEHTDNINALTQYDMAKFQRFAPSGHPYFDKSLPLYSIFKERLSKLGGITPEISRMIGW